MTKLNEAQRILGIANSLKEGGDGSGAFNHDGIPGQQGGGIGGGKGYVQGLSHKMRGQGKKSLGDRIRYLKRKLGIGGGKGYVPKNIDKPALHRELKVATAVHGALEALEIRSQGILLETFLEYGVKGMKWKDHEKKQAASTPEAKRAEAGNALAKAFGYQNGLAGIYERSPDSYNKVMGQLQLVQEDIELEGGNINDPEIMQQIASGKGRYGQYAAAKKVRYYMKGAGFNL